jgi:hypothetical protein
LPRVFPARSRHEMERIHPLLSALLAMAIVGADCKGMCIESKAGHGARAHYGRCSWKPNVRLDVIGIGGFVLVLPRVSLPKEHTAGLVSYTSHYNSIARSRWESSSY